LQQAAKRRKKRQDMATKACRPSFFTMAQQLLVSLRAGCPGFGMSTI